ncbi:thioredoxin, partial [Ornithobacterium rhinotracheale]
AKVDNLPTFVAFKNGEAVQQIQTNRGEVLKQMIDEVTAN